MFQNNTFNKILALALSIALWAFVTYEINPTTQKTFKNISVQITNEDNLNDRGLALADTTDYTVNVTVSGTRTTINSMDSSSIVATVDVSECVLGENIVSVAVNTVNKVQIVEDKTSNLHLQVDKLVTESKSVKIDFGEIVDSNHIADTKDISVKSIDVTGAQSLVESVDHVRADASTADLTSSYSDIVASLTAVDDDDKIINRVSLEQSTITFSAAMRYVKEVALKVSTSGSVPDGYVLGDIDAPNTVTIVGEENVLKDIDSVATSNIALSDLREDTTIPLEVSLPEGVRLAAKSENKTITIHVSGNAEQSFDIDSSQIDINNLQNGLSADITSDTIKVIVSSKKGDITDGDISLSLDASDLTEGTHSVNITVTCDKVYTDISCSPSTAKVIITADEEVN